MKINEEKMNEFIEFFHREIAPIMIENKEFFDQHLSKRKEEVAASKAKREKIMEDRK